MMNGLVRNPMQRMISGFARPGDYLGSKLLPAVGDKPCAGGARKALIPKEARSAVSKDATSMWPILRDAHKCVLLRMRFSPVNSSAEGVRYREPQNLPMGPAQ
jgi:hypothetical protein